MLFNSLVIALFLPVVFILYWFVTNKNITAQNTLLVIASYAFYGWWNLRFLFLIIYSYIVTFFVREYYIPPPYPQVENLKNINAISSTCKKSSVSDKKSSASRLAKSGNPQFTGVTERSELMSTFFKFIIRRINEEFSDKRNAEYGVFLPTLSRLEQDFENYLQLEVLGFSNNFIYPHNCVFDTVYHLNREGRAKRTKRIIEILTNRKIAVLN